ncbi:MAG: PRC-barrel domain-containing protein [bacterium]
MVKAGEVIGRPVIVREGGQAVGKIKDLVVDQPGKQVLGFVISEGLLKSTKVAPWTALQAIGPDSVVLNAAGDVVKAGQAPDIKSVLDKGKNIRGLRLQTTEGKELGKVEDFQFDEHTGAVEGYELSGGLFSDTFGGRSFLPTPMSIELGKDVAFVGPEAEATIQQSTGGIKGAFKRGTD